MRRAIFALSDLAPGAYTAADVLAMDLDELQDTISDAVEWRKEVNRAQEEAARKAR